MEPGWKKFESGIRDKHPGSATLAPGLVYLEDERGEEDEEVLQEECDPRVHVGRVKRLPRLIVEHHVLTEQDPARANQGPAQPHKEN